MHVCEGETLFINHSPFSVCGENLNGSYIYYHRGSLDPTGWQKLVVGSQRHISSFSLSFGSLLLSYILSFSHVMHITYIYFKGLAFVQYLIKHTVWNVKWNTSFTPCGDHLNIAATYNFWFGNLLLELFINKKCAYMPQDDKFIHFFIP